MTTLSHRLRNRASVVVEKIDAVSKQRALTDDESRVLEHFIGVADGTVPTTARMPHRGNVILARMGILRDPGVYRVDWRPNHNIAGVSRHTAGGAERERARLKT